MEMENSCQARAGRRSQCVISAQQSSNVRAIK